MKTAVNIPCLKPELFEGDLSVERANHYLTKAIISVDTETRGLVLRRDRLCLVQLCDEDGLVSFVRYNGNATPQLNRILAHASMLKLFHFGRFDISVLKYYLHTDVHPVWCTKIASKLVRTYTDRHSLKELSRELLGLELDKSDQTSDWSSPDLTESQLEYAANDVRVLIPIKKRLEAILEREGRLRLALSLFEFLPTVCQLDQEGFKDIFEH